MGTLMVKWLPLPWAPRPQHIPEKVDRDAHTGLSNATTHGVSARVLPPDVAPVAGPGPGGGADDGATNRHHPASHRARSGAGACLVLSWRALPAPLVGLGSGACLDHVLAGPDGPGRAGAPGGRRSGHRASRAPRVRPGRAACCRAVHSPRYRLALGPQLGRRVGARHGAGCHPALGPPQLGGLLPPPSMGARARPAAEDASTQSAAVAGTAHAVVAAAPRHLRG